MEKIKLLTLVVPTYKQEKTILRNIKKLQASVRNLPFKTEIIVVIDGHLDKTPQILKNIQSKSLRIIGYPENQGKGFAVRYGMLQGKGDVIGFIDGDLDINPTGISMLINHLQWYDADIVIGSKLHPVSQVDYPVFRKILSWGYRNLIRLLFGLKVRDSQVGLKLFRRKVVMDVFPRLLVKKFAFDIEALAVSHHLGYKRIFEAPIRLEFKYLSNLNAKTFWKTILFMSWDTMAVFYRLHILNYYNESRKLSNAKKIVIFNWRDIKNPLSGGAEILTHEIAKGLVAEGNTVTIFCSHFKKGKRREMIDGVLIIRQGNPDIRSLFNSVHWKAFRYYSRYLKGNVNVVIDEIHGVPFFTRLYVKERIVVLICEVANNVWDTAFSFPWNILGKYSEKLFINFYRGLAFFTISQSTKKDLVDIGISAESIKVIPMGISTYKLPKVKKETYPTAIFVARINKMKGIEDAIEAWKTVCNKYPKAMLWVVGKGDENYLNYLGKKIKLLKLENNIQFHGYISEEKKFKLLAKAHFIVSPSIREGFGLTIPEAGSVFTPAVIYDAPGLRELVDSTNGIRLKKNSVEELSKAMLSMFSSSQKTLRMGRHAYRKSIIYRWENTVNSFKEAI